MTNIENDKHNWMCFTRAYYDKTGSASIVVMKANPNLLSVIPFIWVERDQIKLYGWKSVTMISVKWKNG